MPVVVRLPPFDREVDVGSVELVVDVGEVVANA